MGHGAELQLKDPLLALHSWGCHHRSPVLIGQIKSIPLPTHPSKNSHVLLAMLRKVHNCLSLFLHHSAQWYLHKIKNKGKVRQ